MARADRQSKAVQQRAREAALPQCGWISASGQNCTHPMPCPFHANARKRRADEEAARERQRLRDAAPKCGFTCRDGTACTHLLPRPFHERKRKAEEEAAEANYQDAIHFAEQAYEFGTRARDMSRRHMREMGR